MRKERGSHLWSNLSAALLNPEGKISSLSRSPKFQFVREYLFLCGLTPFGNSDAINASSDRPPGYEGGNSSLFLFQGIQETRTHCSRFVDLMFARLAGG